MNSCFSFPFLSTLFEAAHPCVTLQRFLDMFSESIENCKLFLFCSDLRVVLIWVFYVESVSNVSRHIYFLPHQTTSWGWSSSWVMVTVGHAVSLHLLTQGVLEASVNPKLEVTCPYYFGATKDQCQDLPWPHRALCHLIWLMSVLQS